MLFITFLSLQILLMSGYVFGALQSDIEEFDMKVLMCEEKHAEAAAILIGCLEEMSLEQYASIIKQCYDGLEGDINGQMIKDWYCSHTKEEITQADECSDEMIIAEKGEEFLKEFEEQYGECVESKIPNDKRKK